MTESVLFPSSGVALAAAPHERTVPRERESAGDAAAGNGAAWDEQVPRNTDVDNAICDSSTELQLAAQVEAQQPSYGPRADAGPGGFTPAALALAGIGPSVPSSTDSLSRGRNTSD